MPKWELTIATSEAHRFCALCRNEGARSDCLMPRTLHLCASLLAFISASYSSQASTDQPHRVNVAIVRRESSVHSSVANRDSYLIQITPKSGKAFTARMVDEYPPYEQTLPFVSIGEGAAFSVALRRASYCDDLEDAGSSIRCFAVVHGSWKVPKGQLRDEWWK